MLIIPAIDLRDGKVVRLWQGQPEQETCYSKDPVSIAREWKEQGAKWLHIVDLDGAFSGRPKHLALLRDIRAASNIQIEFGGGMRSLLEIERALETGVERVILGSVALSDQGLVKQVVEQYAEKIAVALDVKEGRLQTSGWQKDSGDSPIKLAGSLKSFGVKRIIYTDILKDGTMKGPNIEMTKHIALSTGLKVIASGGVSTLDDIKKITQLERFGVEGVIIGRALYERQFTLKEALQIAKE